MRARHAILISCALLADRGAAQTDHPPASVKEQFARCSAVFAGKVLTVRQRAGRQTVLMYLPPYMDSSLVSVENDSVTVRVTRAWKGLHTDTVVSVVTMCPWRVPFEVGKQYLIYGFWDSTAVYTDTTGYRTKRLEDAREDLRELGPAIGGRRRGRP